MKQGEKNTLQYFTQSEKLVKHQTLLGTKSMEQSPF